MAHDHQYFLGHSSVEQRRLQQQAGELADESARLFDQIGLVQGSRVVEIGCGPQGCLDLLSSRVGPTGSVVGMELSDEAVQLARRFLSERGIENVEVRQGNAADTGLPREHFDLATARLVLINIPKPEEIVAEMAALVRIDLYIGRRIARMLRKAGLIDVQVNLLIHIYGPDYSRRSIFLQFVSNLHERIVSEGLISGEEFPECVASLERHLSHPQTLVISHLFIQVWGRKQG